MLTKNFFFNFGLYYMVLLLLFLYITYELPWNTDSETCAQIYQIKIKITRTLLTFLGQKSSITRCVSEAISPKQLLVFNCYLNYKLLMRQNTFSHFSHRLHGIFYTKFTSRLRQKNAKTNNVWEKVSCNKIYQTDIIPCILLLKKSTLK